MFVETDITPRSGHLASVSLAMAWLLQRSGPVSGSKQNDSPLAEIPLPLDRILSLRPTQVHVVYLYLDNNDDGRLRHSYNPTQ